jgi:hypothetical protein
MVNSTSSTRALIGLALAVLLGGLIWRLAAPGNETTGNIPPGEKQEAGKTVGEALNQATGESNKVGCFFVPGDQASYHLKTRTKTFSNDSTVGGDSADKKAKRLKSMDVTLDVNLHLRHVQSLSDQMVLAGKLEAAQSNDSALQELWSSKPFETPFYIRMNRQCAFEAIGFEPTIKTNPKALILGLLKSVELRFSPQPGKKRWTVTQSDAKGTALVQYRRMQQSKLHFGRKRVIYIKYWKGNLDHFARAGIGASSGVFVANGNGKWIKSFEHNEIINLFSKDELLAREEVLVALQQTEVDSRVWQNWEPKLAGRDWVHSNSEPPIYVHKVEDGPSDASLAD